MMCSKTVWSMLLQNEERQDIKRRLAGHVMYRLSRAVRNGFQAAYPEVTISVEQLLADAVEWLDELLSVGGGALECCDDLWNDVLQMYRERDGQHETVEQSQVKVAMVFYLLMYCMEAAGHAYYRGSLFNRLYFIIHSRWQHERCRLMEQRLAPEVDLLTAEMFQWMEEYFESDRSLLADEDEEPCSDLTASASANGQQPGDGLLPLPAELNTQRAQIYFFKAIEAGWMSYSEGRFVWHGLTTKGALTQLAYFCGLVYECDYSDPDLGNRGKQLPAQALETLFSIKRLQSHLAQLYKAKSTQQWRAAIDALFQ